MRPVREQREVDLTGGPASVPVLEKFRTALLDQLHVLEVQAGPLVKGKPGTPQAQVSVVVVDGHAVGCADQDHCGSERIARPGARQVDQGTPGTAGRLGYRQLLVARGGDSLRRDRPDVSVRLAELIGRRHDSYRQSSPEHQGLMLPVMSV